MTKILIVNWSWYPSGGDWTYIQNISVLYEKNGFQVIPFSTQNEKNVATDYPNNFIPANDFKLLNKKRSLSNSLLVVRKSIVNKSAVQKLKEILDEHPDLKLVHLHNIHHYITPAIIFLLKKRNIKIMWSLHDYKILCPDSLFISSGQVCEKCKGGKFYNCTINRCKKNSLLPSLLATIDAYYYRQKKVYDLVDAYLCPSEFLRSKFIDFGFDKSKLHVTNLCYNIDQLESDSQKQTPGENNLSVNDRYTLFVGRIEKIKGIDTLVKAFTNSSVKLKIAGTGADLEELRQYIKTHNLSNIEILGFQPREAVYQLIKHSEFVICPSECYENFPFSVIESFLLETPVIGASIGGIPELVINGQTGLLFEAKNAAQLSEKINSLWNDPDMIMQLGKAGRIHVKSIVNFETHWQKLNSIITSLNKKQ